MMASPDPATTARDDAITCRGGRDRAGRRRRGVRRLAPWAAFVAAAGAVAAIVLPPLAGGGAASAQDARPAAPDAGTPPVRVVAPVALGMFVDWFDTENAVVGILGVGAGVELGLGGRLAIRGEGELLLALAEGNATVEDTEGLFLPGVVLFLGSGPGPRPHLRAGPAFGTSELGVGAFLGGGVPVGPLVRLQARVTGTQQGPAMEAGATLALP